jgi:hypothetical protein
VDVEVRVYNFAGSIIAASNGEVEAERALKIACLVVQNALDIEKFLAETEPKEDRWD